MSTKKKQAAWLCGARRAGPRAAATRQPVVGSRERTDSGPTSMVRFERIQREILRVLTQIKVLYFSKFSARFVGLLRLPKYSLSLMDHRKRSKYSDSDSKTIPFERR